MRPPSSPPKRTSNRPTPERRPDDRPDKLGVIFQRDDDISLWETKPGALQDARVQFILGKLGRYRRGYVVEHPLGVWTGLAIVGDEPGYSDLAEMGVAYDDIGPGLVRSRRLPLPLVT